MTRRVTIQTPLGEALQFRQFTGTEELSHLFAFDLDLLSENKAINPKALLGKTATVVVETEGGGKRYLDGIVTRFGMAGQDHRFCSYQMRLRPWLWLATRKSDFKIFQNKTVPDIISEVLGKYGYPLKKKLNRAYRSWDYNVQYNESDFNYVSRLMEHEGIYYYFEHQQGQHTLVLADDIVGSHSPLPGYAEIPFHPPEKAALAPQECVYAWELAEEVLPGKFYNNDYDFKKPRAKLSNLRPKPAGHSHDAYEIYEWPGGHTEFGDGETYARVRIDELQSKQSRVLGVSNARGVAPGYLFSLKYYPRDDQNQQYLITAVHYHFQENPQSTSKEAEGGSIQRLTLEAQPSKIAFRPQRVTPKPRTQGPQTAVVVGPPGEEIWTDEYGRIKVQFHWDRIGQNNENSSCWIRVSFPWAGSNFGGIFIPRIGHEVVVDFLNGDPDYPLVTGCVYNARNMPPWGLPANATQSGILTRSTKGGEAGAGMKDGRGDANAIRFEDKKGAEQLWFHAQKDQLTEVENDEDKWVGNDRRKTIDRDETNHIKRDRTETVDRNEKITVHGKRDEEVDGNETITIHSNRQETVDHNETISIGDNRNEKVGQNESINIGQNQSVKIGQSRSKTVGKHSQDKIGKNWSVKVGRFKTETVGMAAMQNVGMAKMVNIGAGYMVNVGAMMNVNVGVSRKDIIGVSHSANIGQTQTVTVGSTYTLSVGGGSMISMSKEAVTITVGKASFVLKESGEIMLSGTKVTVVGSDMVKTVSPNINEN